MLSARAPSARFISGPIVRKLFDALPGEPDGGVPRQKNPAPLRARGSTMNRFWISSWRSSAPLPPFCGLAIQGPILSSEDADRGGRAIRRRLQAAPEDRSSWAFP